MRRGLPGHALRRENARRSPPTSSAGFASLLGRRGGIAVPAMSVRVRVRRWHRSAGVRTSRRAGIEPDLWRGASRGANERVALTHITIRSRAPLAGRSFLSRDPLRRTRSSRLSGSLALAFLGSRRCSSLRNKRPNRSMHRFGGHFDGSYPRPNFTIRGLGRSSDEGSHSNLKTWRWVSAVACAWCRSRQAFLSRDPLRTARRVVDTLRYGSHPAMSASGPAVQVRCPPD